MSDRVVRTPVAGKPELFDQARDVIRRKHYSIRTEQAYIDWIKRSIIYSGKRRWPGVWLLICGACTPAAAPQSNSA
jgi:hypothetical protein